MCIFGTIGILRRYIDLPSSFIALARAIIGTGFLVALITVTKKPMDIPVIKRNLIWQILSSAAMSFNWIFLFESYNYTTVTTATLCYYMAPSIMVLASHFLFRERLTRKKGICVLIAFCGMVLVSGVLKSQLPTMAEIKGILFGLGAALLYATVILLNKKMDITSAYDKTIFQLGLAGIILIPCTLLTENVLAITFTPLGLALLLVVGMLHTGIAYAMYFSSLQKIKAQTAALFSYLDPVIALLLSIFVLKEGMTVLGLIGAVIVLGAMLLSEREPKES
jgi:RarD protein